MTSCSRSRADPCAASAATSRVASASSRPFLEQLQDDLRLADALGAIRDLLRTVHGGNKIYQLARLISSHFFSSVLSFPLDFPAHLRLPRGLGDACGGHAGGSDVHGML
ncbi:unnamed protein product [Urochloa humidicola]